jgi:hypothetical protein
MALKKVSMHSGRLPARSRLRARAASGVVAVEFAFIFPAFFLLFYAIVTYGLIFAAQQTLTLAAAEGARAAIRYPGGATDSMALRASTACTVARAPLVWLRNMGGLGSGTACGTNEAAAGVSVVNKTGLADCGGATLSCIRVRINYDYANHALVPRLLGNTLSLPTPPMLQAYAVAQVNLL